jgi:hypothetical protein
MAPAAAPGSATPGAAPVQTGAAPVAMSRSQKRVVMQHKLAVMEAEAAAAKAAPQPQPPPQPPKPEPKPKPEPEPKPEVSESHHGWGAHYDLDKPVVSRWDALKEMSGMSRATDEQGGPSVATDVLSIGLLIGTYTYAWNGARDSIKETLEESETLAPLTTTLTIMTGLSGIVRLSVMLVLVLFIIDRILVAMLWRPGAAAILGGRKKFNTVGVAFAWLASPQLAYAFVAAIALTGVMSYAWLLRLAMRVRRPTKAEYRKATDGIFLFNLLLVSSSVVLQSILTRRWNDI